MQDRVSHKPPPIGSNRPRRCSQRSDSIHGPRENSITRYVQRLAILGIALSLAATALAQGSPAGDAFANRMTLEPAVMTLMDTSGSINFPRPGFYSNWTAVVTGSTREANEPNHAGANPAGSVWYTYTTPSNGEFRLTAATNNTPVLAVYTGSAMDSLSIVASSTNGLIRFSATAGTSYQIAVASPTNTYYDVPVEFIFFPPPANDTFDNAVVLSPASSVTNIPVGASVVPVEKTVYDFQGYTLESSRDAGENGSVQRSVWYKWAAPQTGYLRLDGTCALNTLIDIGQGTPADFTNVVSSGRGTSIAVTARVIGGQDYCFRVWDLYANEHCAFNIHMVHYPEPANNNFTNRQPVPFVSQTDHYDLGGVGWDQSKLTALWALNGFGADRETGEAHYGNSAWYSYTPSQSGNLRFAFTNNPAGAEYDVMTGSAVNALTDVWYSRGFTTGASQSGLRLNGGIPYTIRAATYDWVYNESVFELNALFYPAPANDDFANRQALTSTTVTNSINWDGQNIPYAQEVSVVTGSTLGAAGESGEPNNYGRSIWYSWTPTHNEPVTIQTTGSMLVDGQIQDTWLSVYTGAAVSALTAVANNDDANGLLTSQVSFNPTVGTDYKIKIDSKHAGITKLTLTHPYRSANDNFTNASLITLPGTTLPDSSQAAQFKFYGIITNATAELGEPSAYPSIWYDWTPEFSGPASCRLDGNFAGFVLYVYTGNAVNALTAIATSGTGSDGRAYLSFNATAGTLYRISVKATAGAQGAFSLEMLEKTPSAVTSSNNDRADAMTIIADAFDSNNRYRASVLGDASSATLEAGETNTLGALQNAGVELNDVYTNMVGSNSLWWSYTARYGRKLAAFNSQLVAYVPLRSGLGYDPCLNLVNPATRLSPSVGIQFTPTGAIFSNNASLFFPSRPHSGGEYRVELSYTYLNSSGAAYNTILGSYSGSFNPLVVRNSDGMLGVQNSGTFTPSGFTVAANQEYYLAIEANGTQISLWVDRTNAFKNLPAFDANTYYLRYVGAAAGGAQTCGGRIRDFKLYEGLPCQHLAVGVWEGNSLLGLDDDIVAIDSTAGTTYQIDTTPLSFLPGINLAANKAATQSSTYSGAYPASNAVDGNTGNFSHTYVDANAWLEVDLGQVYQLSSVDVWNRADCCQSRVSSFFILVSDTPFPSQSIGVTNSPGVWSQYQAAQAGFPSSINVGRSGRYVRLQITGTDYLNVAEMKVFNQEGPGTDVNLSVSEFWPSPESNDPHNAQTIVLTPEVRTYALPNGTVSTTNMLAAVSGSMLGANLYNGERNVYGANGTVWFKFQAAATGTLTIDTLGSDFDSILMLTSAGDWYNYLAIDDNSGGGVGLSAIAYNVTAGTTYYLQLGGKTLGSYTLNLIIPSPPANDNFAAAALVTFAPGNTVVSVANGPVTNTTYTAGIASHNYRASVESSERDLGADTGVASSRHTVWWVITAPASGYLSVDTSRSTFATQIGIKPYSYPINYGFTAASSNGKLVYYVTQGNQYRLAVDGTTQDAGIGGINLDLAMEASPSNDLFGTPTGVPFQANVLTGTVPDGTVLYTNFTAALTGHNIAATSEAGERDLGADTGVSASLRTVWWLITAPASGYLTIDTTQSTFLTQVGIKPYSYPVNYGFVGASSNGKLVYYVTQGSQYRVAVEGTAQDAGFGRINLNLFLEASPANDPFDAPQPVTFQTNGITLVLPNGTTTAPVFTATLIGYNIAATTEGSERDLGADTGVSSSHRTVWWSITAPANGYLTMDATKSTFLTQIGIKPYSSPVNYGFAGASSNGKLSFYVTQGSQFRVAVEGTTQDLGFGIIDLVLRLEASPVNDNYPGTTLNFNTTITNYETIAEFTITNLTYVAAEVGHNLNATIQSGEYLFGYLGTPSANQTVWWSFSPPASGNAEISLEGSLFDTLLRAGGITAVNSSAGLFNDDLYGWASGLTLPAASGTSYRIDIDGKPGSASGGINLTVRLPAAPDNDLYANRRVLTLQNASTNGNQEFSSVRVAGSTTQAGNENESLSAINLRPTRNVWFEFTPSQNGAISVSVESPGNHALAVFTGFSSGFIAGNNNLDPSMPDATVTFAGTAGTAYKILVDGSIPGPFVLTLKQFSAPTNDNFANRIPLTSGVATTGSVYGATHESGEPSQHGGNGSVWYSFTATCTGQLEIDTDGSASDTILGVYSGNAVNSLAFLRVNNDVDGKITSRVRLSVIEGAEYEIAVATVGTYAGDFRITPYLTCSGWVEATPASGTFSDAFNVWLGTPGNGAIFYSLNGAGFQPYSDLAVTIANLVGVGATDGVVTKTNASGWGNGGFVSAETIDGDGFAETEITQNNTARMFGLDAVDSSTSYTDIDYAIYFRSDGYVDVFEAGTLKVNQALLYNAGDRARVTRLGTEVQYHLNGKLIYTSNVPSSVPLHFDGSIYDNGGQLGKCYLRSAGDETGLWITGGDADGNVTLTAYAQAGNTNTWSYHLKARPPVVLKGKPVTWTSLIGVAQQGLGLVKTSGGNNWNAGAISAETATGDCSVDFIVVNDNMMVGLDSIDSNASYTDIQHAFHVSALNLYIYQNGGGAASFGPVALGDRLRVERRGATMYYFHNDALKATYAAPTTPLHVDLSIYYPGYSVGTLTFFQDETPALYVVPEATENTTRFTAVAAPASASSVTGADSAMSTPMIQSTNSTNYRFRNFRNGFEPSVEVAASLQGALASLQFIVPGPIVHAPDPLTVASASGVGGIYHITFPNGTITNIVSEATSVSFPPQGGGIYSASLYRSGSYPGPTVFTNLSFVVNDLAIDPPSTTYGVIPFTVAATNAYPMSIFYTMAAQGVPNTPYAGPIQLGNTNVTIRFMGTRPGFSPQFVSGTYAYSPNLTITPAGQLSNATAFTITGGADVQYQVGNGLWQSYAGSFTLDGIPGGNDFVRAYFPVSPEVNSPTNATPITFQVATPVVTPPGGPVDGEYIVTASTATTNATIYYALGDAVGSMPSLTQATNLYSGPIAMSGSRNFIFVARKTNYLDSATITNGYMAKIPSPSFVTPSGTFSGPATITVGSGDSYGGQFLLTSPSGTLQSATATSTNATFSINEGGEFILLLRRGGSIDSDPVTNRYDFVSGDLAINPAVPYVYANTLVGFNWDGNNPKAPSIYFTLDGSEPTTNSIRYVGAFAISNTVTVNALGVRTAYTPIYLTNAYTFLTAVSPAPASGTYNNPIQVALTNPLAQTIYYKINSDPDWTTYAGPFPLSGIGAGSVTLVTRYDHALYPGPTNLFSYLFRTADPVVDPVTTNFTGSLTITAADAIDGATIYYAMGNASGGNASSSAITNVYTGPISINSTRHFLFEARRNGYQNSGEIGRTYSSPLPAPGFVTPSGTYSNQLSITVQSTLIDSPQAFVLTYPSGPRATNNASSHIATFNVNETGEYRLQVSKANWMASPVTTNTYTFQTTDLAVNPASQTFSDPLSVTATQGNNPKAMTIFYSTDGSPPTTGSLLYTSALTVSNTTTLRFLGYREGYLPQYVNRTYTYAPGLMISPLSGTNHQAITVTLTPYDTNSTIYYQINSDSWRPYSAGFSIDGVAGGTAIVRAYTVTGPIISPTNTVNYTFQVSNLTVNPTSQELSGPVDVTAETSTPGAEIYFANGNDGGETPTASDITTLYTGPIPVTNTKVLIFEGRRSGYLPSLQVMRIFSTGLAAPSFVTPSATFTNQIPVTVRSGLAGYRATFQLTAPDGSILAQSSASDTASFNINASGVYGLKVSKANWLDSASVSQTFNFEVQDLKVTPASGTFNTPTAVTARSGISNPNPLRIYYTTDGSTPTTNSSRYTGEIVISNSMSFQWLAARDGYAPQYATNTYLYVPAIDFSPGSGTYSNAISVSLNTPASNAQLFYSTNAADWSAYTGPFVIDGMNGGTGTLRSYYTNSVLGTSPTNSFTIHFVTAAPTVTPANLTLGTNAISVMAQSATTNAAIYYSANSTALDATSLPNLYTGPLSVSNRTFMVFQATKGGYESSAQVPRKYIEKLPTPVFLTSGEFQNWVTVYVELPKILAGVSMILTRADGTSETRSAPLSAVTGKPTASFIVNDTGSCAVKAIAVDWEDSDFVTNSFTFHVGDLSTTPDQLFNALGFQVTAGGSLDNPKPLMIHYTTDGSQPDANSSLYTGPVPIAGTTTFTWLATRQGYFPQYRTNTYTFVAPLAVSPAPGIYSNAITLSLTSPGGEDIVYSLDGTTWENYSEPLTFDGFGNGVLALLANYTGGATNTFIYTFKADPPSVNPGNQTIAAPITLTAANGGTVGANVVYFEGDVGGGTVTTNRTMTAYTGPITVSASRSYLFQARKPNYLPSDNISRTFSSKLPAPSLLTTAGTFTGPVSVQVQSGLPGYGGIYRMVDPAGITNQITSESPTTTFQVNGTGTYHFSMQRAGWIDSDATEWTASFHVADLVVSPSGGVVSAPNTPVTASGSAANPKPLTIFYTVDGTEPTTNANIYSQPILINTNTTITWLATRPAYASLLQTNSYLYVAGASISPSDTSYINAQTFAITPFDPAASVFYRTNSSDWLTYTGPFVVDGTTLIQFYSDVAGQHSVTNSLNATFSIAPLTVSPASQTVLAPISVTATTLTAGATILYGRGDVDGNLPDGSAITNVYPGPIIQGTENSASYVFKAGKPGYTDPPQVIRTYTAKLPVPTSALGTNVTLLAPVQNIITAARPSQFLVTPPVYYPGNGSSSNLVVTYSQPGRYGYKAIRNGWLQSDELVVNVSLSKPDGFNQRQNLVLISTGTNFSNGRMPLIYSGLGDNAGATSQPGDWDGTYDDNGVVTTDPARVRSLWYRWVAPTNGLASVSVANNRTDDTDYFIYALYTGTDLGSLSRLVLAHEPTDLPVNAGTEYQIAVYSGMTPGLATEFNLVLNFYPTPINDEFSNPIALTMGQTYSGYTHGAGSENGESGGNSTWWKVNTTLPGTLEVPLSAGQATVWQGTDVAALTPVPLQYWTDRDTREPEITTNNFFFRLAPAGTYHVRIAGENTVFSFTPRFHTSPPHDDFPNTLSLGKGSQTVYDNYTIGEYALDSTSLAATLQTNEPAGAFGQATVWYQWTAPEEGAADITIYKNYVIYRSFSSTLSDTLFIHAYTGNTFADLLPVPAQWNTNLVIAAPALPGDGVPATNNSYGAAQLLPGATVQFAGDARYTDNGDLWWKWAAPYSGWVEITAVDTGNNFLKVQVFTGDRYESLVPQILYSGLWKFYARAGELYYIKGHAAPSTPTPNHFTLKLHPDALIHFDTQPGQLYFLRVSGIGLDHRLALLFNGKAVNDRFEDSLEIPLTPALFENGKKARATVKGRLIGATAESFETNAARTVWYHFTSPVNGYGRVTLEGAFSTSARVFAGSNPTNLVELNPIQFPVSSGGSYSIQVADSSIPDYTLTLMTAEVPGNDMLAQAQPLGRTWFKAYNDFATLEPSEPTKTNGIGGSVWWKYAPSQQGSIYLDCTNKTVVLWQGTNLLDLTSVADNTDSAPMIVSLSSNIEYRISFDTRPGIPAGDFEVQASFYPVPANDDFINAQEMINRVNTLYANGIIYTYTASGYTFSSSAQINEPLAHNSSVWYRWTAPTNMLVNLACELATYVYVGDNLNALVPIGEKAFSAAAGQSYSIAVSGPPSEFTLTLTGTVPPYNDLYAAPITLTNGVLFYNYGAGIESYDNPATNNYSVWWTWTSAGYTNLFLRYNGSSGPDRPLQATYPNDYVVELRVYAPDNSLSYQGTFAPRQVMAGVFLATIPVVTNTDYRISVLSQLPTSGQITASGQVAPDSNPIGSQNNTDELVWREEGPYLNGIISSTTLNLSWDGPDPYWYLLNLPRDGYLLASQTDVSLWDSNQSQEMSYTPLMPVTASGHKYLTVYKNGQGFSGSIHSLQPPSNDVRNASIAIPMVTDTNAGAISLSATVNSYNLLAQTEDDLPNSVWYHFQIPSEGRIQIRSQNATFYLIPTDATSALDLPAATPGPRQVIGSGGELVAPVLPGYYYLAQADAPAIGTVTVTYHARPANDEFESAANLTTWSVTPFINGSIHTTTFRAKADGATVETGEPPADGQGTLWYKVTAPVTGRISLRSSWGSSLRIYSGNSLDALNLLASGDNLTIPASVGDSLMVQVSNYREFTVPYATITVTEIENPRNDAFVDAITLLNSPVTETDINGTNYYLYQYDVPAGFWPADTSGGTGQLSYIRNWYRIEAENLVDVWVNGWNNSFTGPTASANHAYADFATDGPIPYDPRNSLDPYDNKFVGPDARREIFPRVWGQNAYEINVPWTWNYAAHRHLMDVTSTGDDPYAIQYTSLKDDRYKGLFDLTAFPTGPNISYLYAAPANFIYEPVPGTPGLGMSYTFVLTQPSSVKLTPVFPVGRQAAAESVDITVQKQVKSLKAYTYQSTLESGEPSKPGSGGGSVWWKLQMPYAGFVRVSLQGAIPVTHIWKGTDLANLTEVAGNYSADKLETAMLAACDEGDQIYISTDRGETAGEFDMEVDVEPPPANTDPDHAVELVPINRVDFENGTNWNYSVDYTIYPATGAFTNNSLWYRLAPPSSARLTSESADLRLYSPLAKDIYLLPPSRTFYDRIQVSAVVDTNLGLAAIHYTLDGTTPDTNATLYTGPIDLTNTTTVKLVGYRNGLTPVHRSETYLFRQGIQFSSTDNLTNSQGPIDFTLTNPVNDGSSMVYRTEGGEWQTYNGPVQVDGLRSGEGYLYYTTVVNGKTNPVQYAFLRFQAPPPSITPVTAADLNTALTLTATPERNTDTVSYEIDDPSVPISSRLGVMTGNTLELQPSSPVTVNFYLQRSGYLRSAPTIGTYSWSTNSTP